MSLDARVDDGDADPGAGVGQTGKFRIGLDHRRGQAGRHGRGERLVQVHARDVGILLQQTLGRLSRHLDGVTADRLELFVHLAALAFDLVFVAEARRLAVGHDQFDFFVRFRGDDALNAITHALVATAAECHRRGEREGQQDRDHAKKDSFHGCTLGAKARG